MPRRRGASLATAALLATLFTALVAGSASALDLAGGTLRGATTEPDAAALGDLAALDVGDPAPDAEDQLDAIAAEDAALGIDGSVGFVPVGIETDVVGTDEDRSLETSGEGEDLASFVPEQRYVESIPVLAAPNTDGFRPVLPRASSSVVPLGSWTRNNPRSSTVVLGGSWVQ